MLDHWSEVFRSRVALVGSFLRPVALAYSYNRKAQYMRVPYTYFMPSGALPSPLKVVIGCGGVILYGSLLRIGTVYLSLCGTVGF